MHTNYWYHLLPVPHHLMLERVYLKVKYGFATHVFTWGKGLPSIFRHKEIKFCLQYIHIFMQIGAINQFLRRCKRERVGGLSPSGAVRAVRATCGVIFFFSE
jgi:hypothetical protein